MPSPDVISTLPQLITMQDLKNRLTPTVLRQCTDDDKSGTPDKPVLQQIIKDASAEVWSYIADLGVVPVGGAVPDYVLKLTLDMAQGLTYTRVPNTSLGPQGFALMSLAKTALERIVKGTAKVAQPGSGGTTTTNGAAASADTGRGVVRSDRRRRTPF